jgi:hypothetical protein
MEYAPVKLWLKRVSDLMLSIFAASNTYRAFHSMYEQIGAFGVGASIIVDNFENVLHHYPQTFGRYAIGLDQWGNADTIYREITKTIGQLGDEFGPDALSQAARNLWNAGKYDATVEVLHVIEPRREPRLQQARLEEHALPVVLPRDGPRQRHQFLRESGFREFPAIAARWIVDGEDTYASRWPGAVALGSIKQLQQEQLQKSNAIDYMVDPPIGVPVSLKNRDVDRLPGGVTYIDAMAAQGGGVKSLWDVGWTCPRCARTSSTCGTGSTARSSSTCSR